MGGSIRDAIKTYCPRSLQGTVGEKFFYTIGLGCDLLLEKLNQGMRMHIPTYGDASGLATIGTDDLIPQGPNETPAGYAQRLKLAYDSWQLAGSSRSIMQQLLGFLSPSKPAIRIVGNGIGGYTNPWDTYVAGTFATTTAPSHQLVTANWNWDGASFWWRVWIIIDCSSGSPFTCPKWGDGHKWGDGTAWGFSGTPATVQAMQAIVGLWKPANVQVVNIILSYDATLFLPSNSYASGKNPTGQFAGQYTLVSGTATPTRFAAAAYLPGVT